MHGVEDEQREEAPRRGELRARVPVDIPPVLPVVPEPPLEGAMRHEAAEVFEGAEDDGEEGPLDQEMPSQDIRLERENEEAAEAVDGAERVLREAPGLVPARMERSVGRIDGPAQDAVDAEVSDVGHQPFLRCLKYSTCWR